MKLKNKIYLSFLALFGFILLILFIVGITKKENNIKPLINPTITQPPNNQLDSEAKEELNKLQKRLKDLEIINQQNINNNKKLIEEDNQLSQQINSNLETIKTLNLQINNLNQELAQKSKELINKETNLTDETKSQLETEIINLNQQIADLSKQRDQINETTQPLTKKRVENTKSQVRNKKIIENVQSETNKTTQFKDIYQKISDLQQAINYNNANKENIKKLIIKHQDNPQENPQNLESYDLFLDGQLIQFDKQIKQLQNEIEVIKNPNIEKIPKKEITFKDVYGMENEKEQLEDLIFYFKESNNNLVNFDKIRPKGYLLYGPPGTGKTFLLKALSNECNAYFIEFEPSKLDKTYVGEGVEEWEKIWKDAESHNKAIIFIDEISGMANREDKNTNKTSINIVNNILTKLDGFNRSDKKIVLMGATNHLDQIDKALRSRFSKEIKIDLIKDEEIEGFLKFLIEPYQISYHTYLHLKEIANKCKGKNYSNRDLTTIINDAYNKTNKFKTLNPKHEVMLPSDLDEVIDTKQGINKSITEIKARRKECEEQYESWKQGFLKYLKPSKDETKVEKLYAFYSLNGLGRGQHRECEPTDLMPFMKNPFDKWETKDSSSDYFDTFHMKHKGNDSYFGDINFINNRSNHYTELEYEGPKWLIEEDKDFFMDEVRCHIIDPKDSGFPKREKKNYYLHFNPKQSYITLYTKKFNTKKDIENTPINVSILQNNLQHLEKEKEEKEIAIKKIKEELEKGDKK
ncbi:AAA family ATPase [Candidatus Phytoplasma australiense]|uniref:Putative cell division cycle ATPase n=1 Tax=Strawberry lethal yellows phytoplasma (CPA) str. NZSb11 TaxID=980422 RepID=R4RQQ9_PHYAS|nr:AAA family ATPase [Candidatus Phytoplasma australiense]AGL90846.1 Putative cell division cycle ATPase [Strawberry lethal yellows phytoplasma (CPA) str. NZSb11]